MVDHTETRVLMLVPRGLRTTLFSPESDAELRSLCCVTYNVEERNWSAEELTLRIPGYDIAITGWGSPSFSSEVLLATDRLRLVAHSAGSVKHLCPAELFEKGIQVTHAAGAIAPAVAEMTLALIMLLLRQPHTYDRQLKAGETWACVKASASGREIAGQRVGVIGAGYVGRCVISLLQALGAEVWVYDPYLRNELTAELGVHKAGLDELLAACHVVTLHAPTTQETRHMIGARRLGLLRDGAILVNTARSWLVDEAALLPELRSGRIQAALDVFDQEPLPVDSPLRHLDNVILTPHVAGLSAEARYRQGQVIVDEIRRFLAGEPLCYGVMLDMLETMA